MKQTESTEGAAGSATRVVAEENPYLQRVASEEETSRTAGGNGSAETDDEEAAALAEIAAEKTKRKQRRHRRFSQAFIAALLAASVVTAVVIYRQRSTRVEYGRAANQPRALPPPPNAGTTTSRDNRTEQALQEMQQLTGENRSARNAQAQATATRDSAANSDTSTNAPVDAQHPFHMPPNSSDATENSTTSGKSSPPVSGTTNEQPVRSQRSSETSLYVSERTEERLQPVSQSPERSSSTPVRAKTSNTEAKVVLPPFGSMLPVRTIGGIYTLRSGALARLELTRDIVGNGWSMTRGTILVGTIKGGEYDRAYVAIIGFIDPESGKFVNLGGDVLGGDGAAGLKGKSRQVDSRWTRVLGQLGNAALTVTTAALGGRSNGTVVISNGARSPLINPVSGELNGLLDAQSDRTRRTGFVEIVAGTPGYVMVTDLPAAIKGTEPYTEPDVKNLAAQSDIDAVRPATGISEREFAELIANGSPEEIKAKLQRMSPEMRKIALAVLEP
jgi:hypothetical protein